LFKGTPIGIVTQLENGTEMHWIPGNFVFIDVAAGELSTCAVYDDFVANERGVLCWGYPFSYETVWSAATNGALNAHELPLEGFEPETVDVTYNEVCALDTDTGELRCWTLHNTTTPWACDPATDANCCDDLQAPCCNPASEPACCDPSVDPYCSDHRSWGLFPEVDMYACL
jgi:hypothetical protein